MKKILILLMIAVLSMLFYQCENKDKSDSRENEASKVSPSTTYSKHHTSPEAQKSTDSINPRIDRNNLYKPYPLYKDENSGAKLVVKQPQYSISKGDSVKYQILNLDNNNLLVGYRFVLEYWDGKEWNDVPHYLGSVDLGLGIEKESHLSFSFSLSEIERNLLRKAKDSLLKEGKYRIITGISIMQGKRGTPEEIYLYAEFMLVE